MDSAGAVETMVGRAVLDVQRRIEAVAHAASRSPADITLVAVSKTHPASAVLEALACGQNCFGENRVQEAAQKFEGLRAEHPALRLHLIGGLQTNKAEAAVQIADTIETLDRPRLADAILSAAQRVGRLPLVFVQVNIGDESQKSGVPTAQADAFIEACQNRFGSNLRGLMCTPPENVGPAPFFTRLADMRARHGLPWLSMGMSGDFEVAVALGATHVRVGSAIFGRRAAHEV